MMNQCIKLILLLATLSLVACEGDGDDLDQFFADAGNNISKDVPPLPVVKPYIPVPFDPDNNLPDPFTPKQVVADTTYKPDMERPREPLELFPLENLSYVGLLGKGENSFALIKSPDNTIYRVKKGNYMGTNFGKVIGVSEFEVSVNEKVKDELSGDWIERVSSLSLQE